jgi:hypothetical protein
MVHAGLCCYRRSRAAKFFLKFFRAQTVRLSFLFTEFDHFHEHLR